MNEQGCIAHHIALHPVVAAASCTVVAPVVAAAVSVVVAVAAVVVGSTSLAHALVVEIEHAFAVAVVAVVELGQRRKLVMLERQLEVGGRGMKWMMRRKRE